MDQEQFIKHLEEAEKPLGAEERNNIEEKLLNPQPKEDAKPTTQTNSSPEGIKEKSKKQLIADVMEASRRTGVPVKGERTLSRMTKQELKKLLGSIIDRGISQTKTWDNPETIIHEWNKDKPAEEKSKGLSLEVGAKSLFQLNKLVSQVTENIGEYYSSETGISIKGYTDTLDNREEELMHYYKEIYKEYGDEIGKYVSPINMILLINTQCIAQNIVKAEAKKREEE